ncbi:replication restart helicase PriA [Allobaculum sp. JKK-2023]|uniref:replication restart helicase PriA n=1 Tax=Allobaculum sp. JKK-2023 TaxID=3108943 RepID=UPI002B05F732|nr:primosomal protein N' [Allobaculum sp. JKK-2023]
MYDYEVMVEHPTIALSRTFTYTSSKPVQPGCRVFVPFGPQKLTGLVIKPAQNPDTPRKKIKEILKVLDDQPVLDQEQMDLAARMAYQTVSPMMAMIHVMLPNALDARTTKPEFAYEFWVRKAEQTAKSMQTDQIVPIEGQPALMAEASADGQTSQPAAGSRKKLTPLLEETLQAMPEEMTLKAAKEQFSDYRINSLVKQGFLIKEKRILNHGTLPRRPLQPWPELNVYQKNALEAIHQAQQQVVLLHGVTGSGKTEVFFHLAKEALDKGKQVLILVPEISLTPMMEERIASRFDVDVYACHSRLSDSEMVSVWKNLEQAGPCIVIGTRKSVFLPLRNLGLIIMDEEHDTSYKQDKAPRYHARDAAMLRAKAHECKLILASATPSLDSYARAMKGVYGLAEIPVRASGHDARIRLVDLKRAQTYCNYSSDLIQGVTKRLALEQKSMILLNRRGYLPTVRCQACHEFLRCPECNVPLSYHKGEHALVCHVCGKRYPMVDTCPYCGSGPLSHTGQGTERLEEESAALFPTARIVRMDHDTTRTKGAHGRLLAEFAQNGDILMGTQMIAKGLDYHDITLCGILSIDSILSRPDYLASERAYQLAEQAAGRSGRGDKPGEVIIQTFNPDHFVLQCILRHAYKAFFRREMSFRHAGNYPPYVYLATVIIRHEDPERAYAKALEVKAGLEKENLEVLGPAEITLRARQSRYRLIIKSKEDGHLIDALWKCALWFEKNASKCRMDINVHPMNLEE